MAKKEMTSKELRKIARETLASFLRGQDNDVNRANLAIQTLHAPRFKGE